ncbi:MAG: hypothetical protein AB7G39_06020 [Alphaproteobacteria bacterium]
MTLPGEQGRRSLPSGELQPQHRTLEAGLRVWVEEQTHQAIGYVEQLYTFGDRNRTGAAADAPRPLSIGYLALVREAGAVPTPGVAWHGWYRFFPWEDWRAGRPAALDRIQCLLNAWSDAAGDAAERMRRIQRVRLSFGGPGEAWNDERVLERYELLYGIGLVPEPHRDGIVTWATPEDAAAGGGETMVADHRRILATAIARLRGKLKYRPVVFELMPPAFTFLQLQRTVEALAGLRLHKPNFRRLVERQGLVEETGGTTTEAGGRPARLLRFRREVLVERPAPGVGLPRRKSA